MRALVLSGVVLVVGCKEEVLVDCFSPVGQLDLPGALPGDRWRVGDVDGDGREDILGIEDAGAGTWTLHPLLGRGDELGLTAASAVDITAASR